MESHKPKIPRLVEGVDVRALPLGPMEGFVLSRIDASATIGDIADLTSLELGEVVRILEKLLALGVIEWADGRIAFPRITSKSLPPRSTPQGGTLRPAPEPLTRNVTEIPRATGQEEPVERVAPPPPRTPEVAAIAAAPSPPPPPDDGIDLPLDRRKKIDDLYVALDLLDHYQVLGVPMKADKAKIRSSYFEASKAFHPDTAFRKNVGPYRKKMEAIFTRLTEAYDVLSKKKARDEYDAYLESLGETRAAEEALSGEHEVPAELQKPVAAPPAPPPAPAAPPRASPRASPPPPAPPPAAKQSAPTDEGRRVAREVLHKRMEGMRLQARRPNEVPSPPPAPEQRSQKDALRDLTSSLRSAAALTGGLDRVSRHVAEAKRAVEQNDLAGAVRAYRFALAIAPDRRDIADALAKCSNELAVSLAERYETQALYEERYKKWGSAATSWAKVIEGRPDDTNALMHAALALVEAKGDLHQARRFAQKATELAPTSGAARRTLGRVFMAAGLALNARRELEHARSLDPADELTKLLLRELEG